MPDIVRSERFVESNLDAFVVLESVPYDSDEPTETEDESVPEPEDKAIMPYMPEPLLTRKAIEAAHVKRQTESERRARETLADFFRGRIEEVARAVAKQRVKPDPDKADSQAKRIVAKAFDAEAELRGLVKAIAPHMAAAFIVGAGAELELNEKAAKARSARLKGLKYDPSQPRDESGQWGSGGAGGSVSETSGSIAEKRPTPKTKSEIAKSSAVRVDAEIQRYAEDVNEVQIAGQLGGKALKDNKPADVTVEIEGKMHGIELKTVVVGKNDKLTMKQDAQDRKRSWSRKNKATFHTVVLDDRDVFNANGPGKHDVSKRKILYRRGFGSFRLANMRKVTDMQELKDLMGMDRRKLPAGAKAEEVLS